MHGAWPAYELLDFGDGRKLERFGELVIDRPSPAASGATPTRRGDWARADARFNGERAASGAWEFSHSRAAVRETVIDVPAGAAGAFRMHIESLPTGQVGIFPEQWACWQWIAARCAAAPGAHVLNLFAYAGGSTLAAAVAGAAVVHVDAARSVVERARQNAAASSLGDRPLRWIVDDAVKFCRREAKRGHRYDAVILDPPSYGHGPKGEPWQIKRDLLPLLTLCGELTERRPKFALVTCHTSGIGPAELSAYLSEGVFGSCGQPPRTGELALETADGRRLPSGVFARWPG